MRVPGDNVVAGRSVEPGIVAREVGLKAVIKCYRLYMVRGIGVTQIVDGHLIDACRKDDRGVVAAAHIREADVTDCSSARDFQGVSALRIGNVIYSCRIDERIGPGSPVQVVVPGTTTQAVGTISDRK